MSDSITLSDILGYASIGCWLGAQFPQVVENIKLQSCEGLALPFLANWLLGDISNLVGCILTHQLPFQRWLATYFVCIDCMLVAQYFYYYKPLKGPPSILGHIRSATTPAISRRMSVDRGASRYRTLSAVASNMAAAAAIAAHREDSRSPLTRQSTRTSTVRHVVRERSTSLTQRPDDRHEEYDEDIPSAMVDSFRSEGRGKRSPKRVSWSIERHQGRAASVGRSHGVLDPSSVPSDGSLLNRNLPPESGLSESLTLAASADSINSPVLSTRSTRASRKGSTMVFLGVWALFGIGSLSSRINSPTPSAGSTAVGFVLSPDNPTTSLSSPIFDFTGSTLQRRASELEDIEFPSFDTTTAQSSVATGSPDDEDRDHDEPDHDEPSADQVLGRMFAWLCTTLYLTSRLPQIWKNYVRKSVEGLSMYLFVFAFLGNCFYVASILSSPRRLLPPPEASAFIRESIPYLLGSGGTLMFDITIVAQSFCYKPRHKRHSSLHTRLLDDEEAGLLSDDALGRHTDSAISNRGRAARSRSGPP